MPEKNLKTTHPQKILLVEDDLVTAEMTKAMLAAIGHQVTAHAETGSDALKAAKSTPPDIILMDIVLPEGPDGIETAAIIKNDTDIPVIFITSHKESEFFLRSSELIPDGYINKPATAFTLFTAIELARERRNLKEQLQQELNELKLTKTELEKTEKTATAILDSSPDFISLVDSSGMILNINLIGKKILGAEKTEIIGKPIYEFFPDDTVNINRVLTSDIPLEFETIYNGNWFLNSTYPIKNNQGRVEQVAVYIKNITEKKESALKLKKAEDEREKAMRDLRQIFDSAASGIYVADLNGRFIYINRKMKEIFGLEEEIKPGVLCGETIKNELCSTDSCPLVVLSAGQPVAEKEVSFRQPDGNEKSYIIRAEPFIGSNGSLHGIIVNYIDVSEIRELEKKTINLIESERYRLGRDLHDGLGQTLTGISYLLEALRFSIEKEAPSLTANIDMISDQVEESVAIASSLSKSLSPVQLQNAGLLSAIDEMAGDIEKVFGARCRIYKKGSLRFGDISKATNIYLIIKEAVTNSIKHGNASVIDIYINSLHEGGFDIFIEDNGTVNNHKSKEKKGGYGIGSMNYRARLMGGRLSAGPRKDGPGFKVTLWVPES